MKSLVVFAAVSISVAVLLMAGCTPAAPAAAPTKAPAAPAKVAEPTKAPAAPTKAPAAPTKAPEATKPPAAPTKAPEATKAPAAQPTAAPAKKVDFPIKGRAVTIIVPWEPGVGSDIGARALAPLLEKELGTSIEVVNKPGAGSQVGITEAAKAKPDGHTLVMYPFIAGLITYLDPDRKAAYSRKSFEPLALYTIDDTIIAVKGKGGKYKSTKDLVDAARANPDKITYAAAAMSNTSTIALMLEQAAGVRFAHVNVTGGAAGMTAVLGDHVDAMGHSAASVIPQHKSGDLLVVGYGGRQQNKFLPDVKPFFQQGYEVYLDPSNGFAAPAGTPKEIVDILSGAIARAVENPDLVKRLTDLSTTIRYLNPTQFAAYWEDYEKRVQPLVELAKKRQQ